MTRPFDSVDHPLLPEDDSELRYDERTTEDDDADEQDADDRPDHDSS